MMLQFFDVWQKEQFIFIKSIFIKVIFKSLYGIVNSPLLF